MDMSFRPLRHRRHDHLVNGHGPLVDAEQVRNRIAVDVGVEDAGPAIEGRERSGQVRRQRRLADAALAAGDGEHTGRAVDGDALRAVGDVAAQLRGQRRPLVRRHHVEADSRALYPGHCTDVLCDLVESSGAMGSRRR